MKKHFLILLSCLFLTGCDLPSFSSGSQSAAPSVSESEKVTVEVPSISEATVSKEPSVSEEPSISEEEDPYINRSEEQFYANYTPAVSYQDSVYRTKHYFRSGDLGPLPYIPPKAEYQPKFGDTYIRNTDYQYTDNGNGYLVYDGNGNVIKTMPISHPMMSVPTSWPLETSQATIHQQKEVSRQVKILGANISGSTSAATPIPIPMKYISQPVTTTITNT